MSSTECDLTVYSDTAQARHIRSPLVDKQHSVKYIQMRNQKKLSTFRELGSQRVSVMLAKDPRKTS